MWGKPQTIYDPWVARVNICDSRYGPDIVLGNAIELLRHNIPVIAPGTPLLAVIAGLTASPCPPHSPPGMSGSLVVLRHDLGEGARRQRRVEPPEGEELSPEKGAFEVLAQFLLVFLAKKRLASSVNAPSGVRTGVSATASGMA